MNEAMNSQPLAEPAPAAPTHEPQQQTPTSSAQNGGLDYAQTAAVEEPQANDDPLSHILTRPIQAHGEEVAVLKWREPTGGDIEKAGNPIVISGMGGGEPKLSFDEIKMTKMISQLAAIPPSSVRMLMARDWNAISLKIFRFFM
jgi:hypothetical protein